MSDKKYFNTETGEEINTWIGYGKGFNSDQQSDKTRLESLPEFDYEEAGKYRDSLI